MGVDIAAGWPQKNAGGLGLRGSLQALPATLPLNPGGIVDQAGLVKSLHATPLVQTVCVKYTIDHDAKILRRSPRPGRLVGTPATNCYEIIVWISAADNPQIVPVIVVCSVPFARLTVESNVTSTAQLPTRPSLAV